MSKERRPRKINKEAVVKAHLKMAYFDFLTSEWGERGINIISHTDDVEKERELESLMRCKVNAVVAKMGLTEKDFETAYEEVVKGNDVMYDKEQEIFVGLVRDKNASIAGTFGVSDFYLQSEMSL